MKRALALLLAMLMLLSLCACDNGQTGETLDGIPVKAGLNKDMVKAGLERIIGENYSGKEIQTLADAELSLGEAAEKLATVQDVVNYLCARGYCFRDYPVWPYIETENGRWNWNLGAEHTFGRNAGVCGSTSSLFTRLLAGDYDSQGYVIWNAPADGHAFKYFCIDGIYYFCDFVSQPHAPFGLESYDSKYSYMCYVTDDPKDFADKYIAEGDESFGEAYITQMLYYEQDGGDRAPMLSGIEPVIYFPVEMKDAVHVLFLRDGYSVDFAEVPTENTNPPEIEIPDDVIFDWETGKRLK